MVNEFSKTNATQPLIDMLVYSIFVEQINSPKKKVLSFFSRKRPFSYWIVKSNEIPRINPKRKFIVA